MVVDRPREYFNAHFEATKHEVRVQTVEHAQQQRRELTDEVLTALGQIEARIHDLDERLERVERAQLEAQVTLDRVLAVVARSVRSEVGGDGAGSRP